MVRVFIIVALLALGFGGSQSTIESGGLSQGGSSDAGDPWDCKELPQSPYCQRAE